MRRQPGVLPFLLFLLFLPLSEVGRARRWGIAVPLDRAYGCVITEHEQDIRGKG